MRVRCGRGFNNINPVCDVMSETARFRHDYSAQGLPLSDSDPTAREVLDAVSDDTPPADQAVLNADFEAWLETPDDRHRRVAEKLASGLNTADVGRLRGVTRAAIHSAEGPLAAYEEFHGEDSTR